MKCKDCKYFESYADLKDWGTCQMFLDDRNFEKNVVVKNFWDIEVGKDYSCMHYTPIQVIL